jgi:heptose-I-phosphate ethanolaminephosphotransferase
LYQLTQTIKQHKSDIISCTAGFVLYAFLLLIIYWCAARSIHGIKYKYMVAGGILFTYVGLVWKWSSAFLCHFLFILSLYALSIPFWSQSALQYAPHQWTAAVLTGTVCFTISSLLKYMAGELSFSWGRFLCRILSPLCYLSTICLPITGILYGWISGGHLLDSNIILTLFQTNAAESAAYLSGQNQVILVIGFSTVLVLLFTEFYLSRKMGHHPLPERQGWYQFARVLIVLAAALFILPSVSENYHLVTAMKESQASLKEYKKYGDARNSRMERLAELDMLSIKPSSKGLYVLVIGESATRDHMHAYGYNRPTTPWMDSISDSDHALLFRHAFSNHTHTVPCLSLALSEKNQYNQVPLPEACSLMEIARAAGYDTWWISNQQKYGPWDTPTAEIASTASHEVWISGHNGEDACSNYTDEELLNHVPEVSSDQPTLLVIHLMGSHSEYKDRYPSSFPAFSGGEKRKVDTYDTSIAYTDAFLQQLYEKVSQMPSFRAMVYFSDHGEDPDNNKGHESTKFTERMCKIPLLICFSPDFETYSYDQVTALRSHVNSCWTNDLMFNLMSSLMGIEHLPHAEPQWDLSSEDYSLPWDKARTLHGKQAVPQEITTDK